MAESVSKLPRIVRTGCAIHGSGKKSGVHQGEQNEVSGSVRADMQRALWGKPLSDFNKPNKAAVRD